MSGQTLKFSELAMASEAQEVEEKKGIEIEIEVAGPKEPVTRTVKLKLDNRGLIQLSFKEGGKLPEILAGRFTDIEAVKISLQVWQHNEAKQYELDESVKIPNAGDQSISDKVDAAKIDSAAPTFDVKLDDALMSVSSDDDIVTLS